MSIDKAFTKDATTDDVIEFFKRRYGMEVRIAVEHDVIEMDGFPPIKGMPLNYTIYTQDGSCSLRLLSKRDFLFLAATEAAHIVEMQYEQNRWHYDNDERPR